MTAISIGKFVDLSKFSETQQHQLIDGLTEVVLAHLSAMIGDHLSDEEVKVIETLSASNDQEKMLDWFNQTIPNLPKIIEEILKEETKNFITQTRMVSSFATQEV